jgi:beta-galactosidase
MKICLFGLYETGSRIAAFMAMAFSSFAFASQPEFSVAGFFPLKNSGREVYDFNAGWRFHRGDVKNAESVEFNDSQWDIVCTPHTVQLMPAEASGSRNYQGKAWYRKHFTVDKSPADKLLNVYFEAAMGRSEVYLNGKKILEHFGGYLPFGIELTEHGVKAGDRCIIAVMTDNSDDRNYPPGKTQTTLDFAYHGGIYRDVRLIATSKIHITDPNKAGKQAGGGVFVQYGEINDEKAEIKISTDVANDSERERKITVENILVDKDGKTVKKAVSKINLKKAESKAVEQKLSLSSPVLWHPDSPNLYRLETRIIDEKGNPLDGGTTRIGIRKVEFRGKDGFWLNGRLQDKLIGGNRHQDYAYVGNAVPDSRHRRDAQLLREAGCKIVRVAHYPQDPSFMDACDELGLFVIVATPGWQFWNKDPRFEELIYDDIRNMVRRDRNHPCVLMWEPILNETRFPLDFSLKARQTVLDECPGSFCVADSHSAGVADHYDVVYGWPKDAGNFKQSIFTREFGENVDDWYAHNTNNRASRSWGENALVVQALHLAKAYNEMYPADRQFIGGALWHPFDHQRGYHPDPYWGGLLDAFRQPKYSFYMFKSQNSPVSPTLFIAHEMSPFSSPDVTVFTNCDEVRLILYETDTLILKTPRTKPGLPNPPVVFKDVFDFNKMRIYSYVEKNWRKISMTAEGLIDGKVVCTTKKMPARRSTKLRLSLEDEDQQLVANGSDFIPVICEVTDDEGNVRRLAKERILFSIEGEGEIIGDEWIGANPREVEFGSAPVLIRSTLTAGKVKVHAQVLFEGEHAPTPAEIEFESIPSALPLLYSEKPATVSVKSALDSFRRKLTEQEKQKSLNEVEKQQTEFGEKK